MEIYEDVKRNILWHLNPSPSICPLNTNVRDKSYKMWVITGKQNNFAIKETSNFVSYEYFTSLASFLILENTVFVQDKEFCMVDNSKDHIEEMNLFFDELPV